jgi:glycosyltransferase involved in cell wall biosynthesis
MSTHAQLLQEAGHEPFLVAGRGNPGQLGLPGVIIPEIDSRSREILRVQGALRNEEAWALPEFNRWAERIHELLLGALDGSDVCVVHNAFTLHKNLPLTVALAKLAEKSQGAKRWIAWCHDLAWNNPLYADELLPRWPWTPLKYPLPNVTYVAISERRLAEMSKLFRMPAGEIALVPNGIDPTAFIPSSGQMNAFRKQLHWDERDLVLLAPVRITRRKNLELAIEVTACLRDMGVCPLLVVTGPPGPHNVRSSEYLEELLQRRKELDIERDVVFLAVEGDNGRSMEVSDEAVAELYWWADALLLPSQQEGFGLPLLEAGLARLPVFCSDIGVLREVGGQHASYFAPDADPEAVAQLILKTLRKPGTSAYRRKVLTTYSWDAIFESRLLPLLYEGHLPRPTPGD